MFLELFSDYMLRQGSNSQFC